MNLIEYDWMIIKHLKDRYIDLKFRMSLTEFLISDKLVSFLLLLAPLSHHMIILS